MHFVARPVPSHKCPCLLRECHLGIKTGHQWEEGVSAHPDKSAEERTPKLKKRFASGCRECSRRWLFITRQQKPIMESALVLHGKHVVTERRQAATSTSRRKSVHSYGAKYHATTGNIFQPFESKIWLTTGLENTPLHSLSCSRQKHETNSALHHRTCVAAATEIGLSQTIPVLTYLLCLRRQACSQGLTWGNLCATPAEPLPEIDIQSHHKPRSESTRLSGFGNTLGRNDRYVLSTSSGGGLDFTRPGLCYFRP